MSKRAMDKELAWSASPNGNSKPDSPLLGLTCLLAVLPSRKSKFCKVVTLLHTTASQSPLLSLLRVCLSHLWPQLLNLPDLPTSSSCPRPVLSLAASFLASFLGFLTLTGARVLSSSVGPSSVLSSHPGSFAASTAWSFHQ